VKKEVIKINAKDYGKCLEFAQGQIETSLSHYKRRGQGSQDKIIEDIVTGKLGEIAAYRMLKRHGIYAKEPDFEIYDTRGKSFDADITWKGVNFHCKSQSDDSANKYGTSWILQYGGNGYGHTDKLFKACNDNDFLVPSRVCDNHVILFGIYKIQRLFDQEMIKLPRLKWFQDSKRAIYLEDLSTLSYYDRWGFLNQNKKEV
jgi:hypothetical protein